MKNILKEHYIAIILSVIIGFSVFYPQIYAINSAGSGFQGIYKSVANDDVYYRVRAKEVLDGHPTLGNPYIYEHKNENSMQFWLPDYLLAKPIGLFFGGDVNAGFMFNMFFLPIIVFLLTYLIFFSLLKDRLLSISGTLFLNGGLFFYILGRMPSPTFNIIFWLTAFYFLFKFSKSGGKIYGVLATLNFGFLFYVYTYYWTLFAVFLVVFAVCGKLLLNGFKLKPYVFILGGGFAIGIPYFLEMWQSSKLPYYGETLARLGMLDTHFPSGIKIVAMASILILLFLFLWKKKIIQPDTASVLLGSAVLSSAIVANQHIITGKNLEFSSHYWQQSAFCFAFLSLFFLNELFKNEKFSKWKKWGTTVVIIVAIFFAFTQMSDKIQEESYYDSLTLKWQNYAPAFNWLNNNAPKESVVFANSEASGFIPLYTSDNIYYGGLTYGFFLSDAEVRERFIINNFWENFTEEFVKKNQQAFFGTQFTNKYAHDQSKNKLRQLLFLKPVNYEKIPEGEIENVMALSDEIKKSGFEKAVKKYRINYLLWDKISNPEWQPKKYDFLKPVYEDGRFVLYKAI